MVYKLKLWAFIIMLMMFLLPLHTNADRGLTINSMKSEQRIALVIGNGQYQSSPLKNPPNDAEAIATALSDSGFKVIKKIDVDQREMKEAIRTFGESIRGGGVGLFYFAGHGLQINGTNYLVPIGAEVQSESEVEFECIAAGFVLGKMHEAKNRLNIIILDACRNNPFARSFTRSTARGLARMDAPTGSILCFATSPGSVAADGTGENGLYTEALLKYMRIPGMPIERVFKSVREEVIDETQSQQVPWESTSLTGDFYFFLSGQSSDITLPTDQSASFDDIERERLKHQEAIEEWSRWMKDRSAEYDKAKQYDDDSLISRENKIKVWQSFLGAVQSNNPYSSDDEKMRSYAQERLDYWQNWRPEPTQPPQLPPTKQLGRFLDHGNGTVTDNKTGLMWTIFDSWNDTGGCMKWNDAAQYVQHLNAGGHYNWRMPTLNELMTIFDKGNPTVKSAYKNGKYDVFLPAVFKSGGAIWYWSSEKSGSKMARYVNFRSGNQHKTSIDYCLGLGVRAVRRADR